MYRKIERPRYDYVNGKSSFINGKEEVSCTCPVCGKTCSGEFPRGGGFFETKEHCEHFIETVSGGRDASGCVIVTFVF